MKKIMLLLFLTVLLGMFCNVSAAVLISPTGDGGFETGGTFALNNWTMVNGTYNTLTIGSLPTTYAGSNCAYSWNGSAWTGTANASVNHFYRDITFPAGQSVIQLSFYYKVVNPDATYDFLKLWMVPTTTTPVAGTQLSSTQIGLTAGYDTATSWTLVTATIPGSYAGTTARLVFSWKTDGVSPFAAVAIDNVSLTSETPPPALTGTKTINPSGSGTDNYLTFTAAINALNIAGVGAGGVTFNVSAGATFAENCPAITATGTAGNQIIFQKSGAGNNPKITPTGTSGTTDAGVTIQGGDYITFDGIDIDASAVTAVEYGYYIRNNSATDGAQYNTIKNCSIRQNRAATTTSSSYAIYQNVFTAPTNASGANSYNKYYNFIIQDAINGVYLNGNTSYRDLSCEVGTTTTATRNTISNLGPTTSTYWGTRGVYAYAQEGIKIFNNDISAVAGDQATSYGIYYTACYGTGNLIYNNSIKNVSVKGSTFTTSVAYGINAANATSGTNNVRIYNNFISNIYTSFTSTATISRYAIGMLLGVSSAVSTQTYDVDNNNISIGNGLTPTFSNTCLELQNASAVYNVRGNVFANLTNAQTGVAKHFGIVATAAGLGATGSVFDYNDFYIANNQGTSGHVGRNQSTTTNYNAIADWKTFTTGTLDENSFSANPQFIDNNTDLHVAASSLNAVAGYSNQAWVTTDFDYETRSSLTPSDVGADAFTPTIDSPTAFSAAAVNDSRIDLTFTAAGNNVVILYNTTGTFTTPSGTPPTNVGDAFAGGFFLYNGTSSPQSHTGLAQRTTYYYKAYSYNGVYSIGLTANATTYGSPVVTSSAATSVTYKTAVANGNVTSDGSSAITERGICYGTSADPTTSGSKVIIAGTTGTYSAILSGLTASTIYHFRAYAINAYGTSYSADMTFTTLAPATITTFPFTEGFDAEPFAPAGWLNYGVQKTNGAMTADAFWSRVTSGTYNSTTGAAKVAYSHNALVWGCLELPPVDLPANHALTFYWRDADSKIAAHDTTFCEISINGGVTWTVLASLAAASSQTGYAFVDIPLNAYAGSNRLIRFRDGTDAAVAAYGTFLDAVKIDAATVPPNAVSTPTPASPSTSITINTTLSWVTGGGAPTGYKVYIGTTAGTLTLVATQAGTTYTPASNFLFGTQYFWRVDAYNDYGTATGTEWNFTTGTGIATTPSPASPTTGYDATNRTLGWTAVAGASGYKVCVGTTNGGTELVNMAAVVTNNYTNLSNWPWSTQLYWKVYTVNGSQEVAGTVWTFTTGANPTLNVPTLQDFTTFPPTNWFKGTGVLAAPSTVVTGGNWTADGFGNVTSSGAAKLNVWSTGLYSWLITPPIDLGGAKASSYNLEFDLGLWDFGTSLPITNDTNGTTGIDDKFAVVISTDGSSWTSANTLRLWDNTGSPYVYNDINGTTSGEHITIDLSSYSGIVRIGFYGESTVSNADNDLMIDNFQISAAGAPPTAPTTYTPANTATSVAVNTTLAWSGATGNPTHYKVFMGTSLADIPEVADQNTSPYAPAANLLFNTTYYWYIKTFNDFGEIDSTPISFTTATGQPGTPSPSSPSTNVSITSTTLDWADVAGATGYLITVGTSSGASDIANGVSCATSTWTKGSNWNYSSTYYWHVTVLNSAQSVIGAEWNFTTGADPTIVLPYYNTFSGSNPTNGWSSQKSAGVNDLWSVQSSNNAIGGAPELRCYYQDIDPAYSRYITPPINTSGISNMTVKFRHMYDWYANGVDLKLQISSNLTDWTDVWTVTPTDGNVAATEVVQNINSGLGGTVYLGWFITGNLYNTDGWFLDNIKLLLINTEITNTTATGGSITLTMPSITNTTTSTPLTPQIAMTGVTPATATVTVGVGYASSNVTLPNAGLNVTLSGATSYGNITITHNLGFIPDQIAYRTVPGAWQTVNALPSWTTTTATFTPAGKGNGDVEVVFPQQDGQTLPVEMSSFTAVLTDELFVKLNWVVQSETDNMGYNVLRSYDRELNNCVVVNSSLISSGVSNGTEIAYTFADQEVDMNTSYYYWLENVALNGEVEYYGPVMVTVGIAGEEPPAPIIPLVTALLDAYPNPFNPTTTLHYLMKDGGSVSVDIYNVKGQLIRSFAATHAKAGHYRFVWDGKDMNGKEATSGMYFYRMNSGKFSASKKMILMK